MNIKFLQLQLIQWMIHKKKQNSFKNNVVAQPRQFGCGKGIFTYVADDFDATPPGFEEYMTSDSNCTM